ncbi:MAG: V-type ATPase subunit [Candidatus Edwardsbacteria bacterium]|jgi:V/A-type H+-transporting ATPase subunit C|nr:V-type ATPase subunit [Candidatus Edwardsbacteria bacterium]
MPSDYGYINARVKGWHGRLLPAGAFAELADLPDLPAFLKWMEGGPYAADWQLARARSDGLDAVELALESNFGAMTARLLAIAEGRPRRLIAVLLRRWDLANLKTVVRGIARDWSGPEILANVWPAGTFDRVRLKELAEQRSLRGVADVLATWRDPFAAPLSDCLPAFERDRDVVPVDLALDRCHYAAALRELSGSGANKGLLREMVRREIDAANAKAVKRLSGGDGAAPGDIGRYLIDGGGTITAAVAAALMDPRRRGPQLRALRGTVYHAYLTGGDPLSDEDELDRSLWSAWARLYRARPLAIDVVVGFLWQKYYELVNLRLLARAKNLGLPPARIREQLFLR